MGVIGNNIKKRNNINIMKIGILIPITSKNRNWRTIKESYIYNIFLKSFLTTYCQQYEYTIYLGFDDDDKIFSKIKEQKTLLTFVSIMKNVGLKFIPMGNINKGHLTKMWTKLMNIAYDENCDYFYQCGDDIEFLDKGWVTDSIGILKQTNDIGVTGPYEKMQSRVLTQSFVSRKHKDIFGYFFPHEIINWFCDDWMTWVYKPCFFLPLYDKWCLNLGGQERYEIVGKKTTKMKKKCKKLIERDREKIFNYIKNMKIDVDKVQQKIKIKYEASMKKNDNIVKEKYNNILKKKFKMGLIH